MGMFLGLYAELYKLILADIQHIELSSKERRYYMGRFGQSMVPFAQLKMAETIGKGTTDLYVMIRHKQSFI